MAARVPSRGHPQRRRRRRRRRVAPRRHRGGHGGREDAGGLAPVAVLVRAGDVDRLRVRAVRVAGVHHADRRHVHGGAAVDDVADAGLAGIGVRVAQPGHQPRSAAARRWKATASRSMSGMQTTRSIRSGTSRSADVEGVEVVALGRVHPHQRVGHQRVVGDVPVALVVRRQRPGGGPVGVEGRRRCRRPSRRSGPGSPRAARSRWRRRGRRPRRRPRRRRSTLSSRTVIITSAPACRRRSSCSAELVERDLVGEVLLQRRGGVLRLPLRVAVRPAGTGRRSGRRRSSAATSQPCLPLGGLDELLVGRLAGRHQPVALGEPGHVRRVAGRSR